MKNIQKLIYLLLGITLLMACEEMEKEPVVVLGDAPALTQPAARTELVFQMQNAETEMVHFEWSSADFGFPSATTYILQVDSAGNNFENAFELDRTNESSISLSQAFLNERLLTFGLETNEPTDVEFRVVASVSEFASTLASEPLPINVTLFASTFPSIYMIGAAVGAGIRGLPLSWFLQGNLLSTPPSPILMPPKDPTSGSSMPPTGELRWADMMCLHNTPKIYLNLPLQMTIPTLISLVKLDGMKW
ncbi:MAG: SusE domain-containing protein [Mariniphaga sp.]